MRNFARICQLINPKPTLLRVSRHVANEWESVDVVTKLHIVSRMSKVDTFYILTDFNFELIVFLKMEWTIYMYLLKLITTSTIKAFKSISNSLAKLSFFLSWQTLSCLKWFLCCFHALSFPKQQKFNSNSLSQSIHLMKMMTYYQSVILTK